MRIALAATAGLLALLWSGLLAAWHVEGRASVLDRLEAMLLDLRFLIAGPRPAPPDLLIVAIDDDAVREAGRYPLPRSTIARLLRELARHEPKAIGLDILFLDPGAPEQDADLAAALRETRAVIAAAGLFARAQTEATRAGATPLWGCPPPKG